MYEQIGERLRAVRVGCSGITQRDFAQQHGFNVTQYNNWERGIRRIPVDDAEKLCVAYGLTLDFIYLGKRAGLSDTTSKVV
jgi:transcriptional regulator with XRE-family HTH domain